MIHINKKNMTSTRKIEIPKLNGYISRFIHVHRINNWTG
jgi:hypothetical protein